VIAIQPTGQGAARTAHGRQESTLHALFNSVHHFGGIVVAPGYTDPIKFADGNPYGASHLAGQGDSPVDDRVRAGAAHQGKRAATVAAQLLVGRTAPVS
jgi:NAD(P)H dehydrogenase (quinone)